VAWNNPACADAPPATARLAAKTSDTTITERTIDRGVEVQMFACIRESSFVVCALGSFRNNEHLRR